MIEALNAFIESHADSAWLLPVVLLVCVVDGILPPAPAETVMVALGAVAVAEGEPNVWALIAVAALGGFLGDNLTYSLGRYTRLGRLRESPRPKVRSFVTWVTGLLLRRGGVAGCARPAATGAARTAPSCGVRPAASPRASRPRRQVW